ncbi:methionine adenosyltransferase 2 subunit beta isoform X3 [Rhinoraja longicauda]
MVGKEKELTIHFSPGSVRLIEEDVYIPDRRVLVTGASGLLGRAVHKEFLENNWDVVGCAYRRARPRFETVNLLDPGAVRRIIQDVKPQVIVHCAAERRPDVVENRPDYARQLNVSSSGCLAREAGAAVLRVPVLYGPVEELGESAVTVLFGPVQGYERTASIDHCQQRYPTHVADVALVCRQLSERWLQDSSVSGVFHWSGTEQMTKYQMACTMADVFRLPNAHLRPATEPPAQGTARPRDCCLDCSRLERMGLGQRTAFRAGVRRCLWPFLRDKQWQQTVFH